MQRIYVKLNIYDKQDRQDIVTQRIIHSDYVIKCMFTDYFSEHRKYRERGTVFSNVALVGERTSHLYRL